jgi:hypothetical protein
MFSTELPLSFDSLIVAIALAGWLPKRHILPLAVLFGLFDGCASAVGPALGVQIDRTQPALEAPSPRLGLCPTAIAGN